MENLKTYYTNTIDSIIAGYNTDPNGTYRVIKTMILSLRAVGEFEFATLLQKYAIAKIKRLQANSLNI